jgi:cell division septation protein DedD
MSNAPDTPVRSPSYPAWPLAEAVTAVRKIEAQYRSAKVDRQAAAKIIGYSGLSGPANKALAALAQFGLVERAGKGEMRVTDRARAILHPDSPEEKRSELRSAALEPQLFRELQERWPNMIPPEDGVIMYFNRKGFNQSAIRPAAKAYLETLLYLEEENASESHGNEDEAAPDDAVEQPSESVMEPQAVNAASRSTPLPALPAIGAAALNKLNMNIQADVVHLSAVLDYRGLSMLEKKIASLKVLMAPDDIEEDAGDDEDDTDLA